MVLNKCTHCDVTGNLEGQSNWMEIDIKEDQYIQDFTFKFSRTN